MKLVTYITPDYAAGLKVLAHSLSTRGGFWGNDWIVLSPEPLSDELGLDSWLAKCGFVMENRLFSDVGQDKWPDKFPETRERLRMNWNKLRVFLLPPGEYIWMDADLLCMKSATALFNMPAISGCQQSVQALWAPGIELGLFRFDADPEIFDLCMKAINASDWVPAAEQTILGYVAWSHPEKFHILPYWYDMLNYVATRAPKLWKPEKAVFIHFAGDTKPWHETDDVVGDIWRDYAKEVLSDKDWTKPAS